MPIIKSAKKRVKVSTKAHARNVRTKRNLRDAMKGFAKAVTSGKPAEIAKAERDAVSAIDMAAKKAVIHKNKAARQKVQLSARAKAAGVKPAKVAPKKASTKKTPVKKAVAKKPALKKPSPKK
jgi:small subunit ribosomal protein S20